MKKKIEIEFDNEDRNGFTEVQVDEMNKTPKAIAAKKYPVHHEDPIVMSRPKLSYPKGKR